MDRWTERDRTAPLPVVCELGEEKEDDPGPQPMQEIILGHPVSTGPGVAGPVDKGLDRSHQPLSSLYIRAPEVN